MSTTSSNTGVIVYPGFRQPLDGYATQEQVEALRSEVAHMHAEIEKLRALLSKEQP